ncbi:hypothetical protein B0E46_04690 [Rhodanobacter sp. B04]|nr:hypothetical protein B0E46_04690 [Rhodanobacter sp. B04]
MKGCKKFILLSACALLLAACGKEVVDSRQIDVNDGLAYKHGLDDPYTGIVSFKGFDSMPEAIKNYWITNENFGLQGWLQVAVSAQVDCDVSYTKGLANGPVKCTNPSGDTLLTAAIADERFDGSSTIRNPLTGKLFAELNWKAGNRDGKQLYYAADGETVIEEVHYASGQKDGREIERSTSGDVLTDGIWGQGKPVSGKIRTKTDRDLTAVATFVDGTLDGPATIYGYKDQPPAVGSFKKGMRDGPWTDNQASSGGWRGDIYQNNQAFNSVFGTEGSLTEKEIVNGFDQCKVFKSNWANGALQGPLECTAGNGTVVLSMTMDGSKIVGSFLYHDVITGTTTHLMQSDGKLVPADQVDTPATSPANNVAAGATTTQAAAATPPLPSAPPSTAALAAPAQSAAPPVVTSASTNVGTTAEAVRAEVAQTYQPGFDCAKAQSPAELTICADPLLSALDSDVAAQYHALAQQADPSQKGDLLSSQREYLAARNICKSDRACVERQTRSRLHDLRQQAARTPGVLIATLKSDHVSAP